MDKKEFAMKNPKVSIIIPVYNSEKTVGKCLDSLIGQTYKDIEIICVNDCSKDDSLRVLKSYADKDERIVIINHTENKNAGGARNSGIRVANGVYICLVDNDDWLVPNAIELLVDVATSASYDLVTCAQYEYYSEDKIIKLNTIPDDLSVIEKKKYGLLYGASMLGALIKKSLYVDNELKYPEFIFYEDNPVHYTLLLCASSIKSIDVPLYYYARSEYSVTGFSNIRKLKDRVTNTELLLENIKERNLYTKEIQDHVDAAYIGLLCRTIILFANCLSIQSVTNVINIKKKIGRAIRNSNKRLLSTDYQYICKRPFLFYCILTLKIAIKRTISRK